MAADEWIWKAHNFIETAKLLVRQIDQATGSIGPGVGLLAWQGTEDSLKAVCVGHTIPFSHDLSKIMEHIRASNLMNEEELGSISKAAKIVTGSATYNDARYPGSNRKWWEKMRENKLKEVTEAAQSIFEVCARKIASQ